MHYNMSWRLLTCDKNDKSCADYESLLDLRCKVEELLKKPSSTEPTSVNDEDSELIYELQVQQIELEMQNVELKRLQHSLEVAREKYQNLFDRAPVGYLTLDQKGKIVESNLRMASMLGLDREALQGRAFNKFIDKKYQDIFFHYQRNISKSNKSEQCEIFLHLPNGDSLPVHLESEMVEEDVGESAPVWEMVVTDITKLNKSHEDLGKIHLQHQMKIMKNNLRYSQLKQDEVFSAIITQSPKMRAIFEYIEAISSSPEPVLVTGETGVGKESLVNGIRQASNLTGPLVSVNVAGLDDTMFSDTLFGHSKGAFTSADTDRIGLIAQAAGGTLFLDEIGDIGQNAQIKLLRLIQERQYRALGSDILLSSKARIICATNYNLPKRVAEGLFRADLFYRLSSHKITIPPIRERLEDLSLLIPYFLEGAAKILQKKLPTFPRELLTLLSTYSFPGNIRELRAMIFDAVAQHRSGILSLRTFQAVVNNPVEIPLSKVAEGSLLTIHDQFPSLKYADSFLIDEALKRADGNQGIAASLLGISRRALNKRLSRRVAK